MGAPADERDLNLLQTREQIQVTGLQRASRVAPVYSAAVERTRNT